MPPIEHVRSPRRRGGLRTVATFVALSLAFAAACSGNILGGDDGDGDSDDPQTPGGWTPPPLEAEAPRSPMGRLTQGQYLAAVAVAFGSPPPRVVLPSDGSDGVFASNAAAEGIGDFNGYVSAAETVAAHYASELLGACDWAATPGACVDTVLLPIASSLFRGRDDAGDAAALSGLMAAVRGDGATAQQALASALALLLLDERFLFVLEYGGTDEVADDGVLLGARELAVRLSFLLANSPPDAQLRVAIDDGLAADADLLAAEVDRLLDQPGARDQLWRFVSTWLGIPAEAPGESAGPETLGDECDLTAECVAKYGDRADDCVNSGSSQSWCGCGGEPCRPPSAADLGASMIEETRRFVEYVVFDSGAPLSELFTANYSFIDAALAEHYGVPAPETDWERYEFPPGVARRGILTHASFLTANGAHERDVSWIFRGKIVYERLFCGELPPPPPDATEQDVELREEAAECMGCHALIDPMGRLFDGYDEFGAVRADEAVGDSRVEVGSDVDGEYPDAVSFAVTVANSEAMVDCFTKMWFRFALSRRASVADQLSFDVAGDHLRSHGSVRDMVAGFAGSASFRTLYVPAEDRVCE